MKKMIQLSLVTFVSSCLVAGTLVATPAHGKDDKARTECPKSISNPLELLQGTWGFNTAGTRNSKEQPVASAGSFVASMNTQAGRSNGVLTITTTTSRNGEIVELDTGTGSYEVFPDCSGGTLHFNLQKSGSGSYYFFFGSPGDISLVGSDFGDSIWGSGGRNNNTCIDQCNAQDDACRDDASCVQQYIRCVNRCNGF
jgi:hypothetical protein